MTVHDDVVYVALMRDEIRGVMDLLEECTREQFVGDRMLPGAAAYHFMRLAERPLKASAGFRSAHPEIPWEELADIRSRGEDAHFKEDPATMWEIGTTELPAINDELEALLPADALWRYRSDEERDAESAETRDEAFAATQEATPGRSPRIDVPSGELDEICRRYDVRRIRLFGSVLRDDFGPDSDVDMLVDFGPGAPEGWNIFRLDDELSELLGQQVDVIHGTPVRYIRERILAEATTIYVANENAAEKGEV